MAKLSVIVPIYNVEKYLRQCLDSVVNQTFRDLEIILIDDGSPDRCGEICDEYEKRDNRIKVIHKENGGLPSARNDGIDMATGEWVAFVDSDDWLELDIYEKAIAAGDKYDVDILFFNSFRNSEKKESKAYLFEKEFYSDDKEYIKSLQAGVMCKYLVKIPDLAFPWNRIIRRKIIITNKLHFQETRAYEDLIYAVECMQYAEKIAFINSHGYHYRENELSISRMYNPNRISIDKKVFSELIHLGKLYQADEMYYSALNAFIVQVIANDTTRYFFNSQNKNNLFVKLKYASEVLKTEPCYTAFSKVDRKLLTQGGKLITILRHHNVGLLYLLYLCKVVKKKVRVIYG